MRKPYLVAYDYGQGAVWVYITAESAKQINDHFPDFRVFETTPAPMTEAELAEVASRMSFDLDQPSGWLKSVTELRKNR